MDRVPITSSDGGTVATFVPAANLVCASLRCDGAELLDSGHGLDAYAGHGRTMGIPLLYPWANRLSRPGYAAAGREVELPAADGARYPVDPGGLPIHGALPGDLRWDADADADRLSAGLAWEDPQRLALFPFRHSVGVRASVGASSLTIETTVRADRDDPVPVSFGYHPYLTLAGSDRRGWEISLGATRRLVLDEAMIPTGERAPLSPATFTLADTAWDDGLDGLTGEPPAFVVAGGGRAVTVAFQAGYPHAQVFAPPGRDFICFEPMTAVCDALNSHDGLTVLAPGQEYTARFRIAVSAR